MAGIVRGSVGGACINNHSFFFAFVRVNSGVWTIFNVQTSTHCGVSYIPPFLQLSFPFLYLFIYLLFSRIVSI